VAELTNAQKMDRLTWLKRQGKQNGFELHESAKVLNFINHNNDAYNDFPGMKTSNDAFNATAKAEKVLASKKDIEDNQDLEERIAEAQAFLIANNHTVTDNR